jgi:D-alanine-D-alanine ligase-like ATP-grasp enzyme
MNMTSKTILQSLADIKRHFAENDTPIYFVSATNFNLMGMHDWVRNWHSITLVDCFDGRHPQVMVIDDDHLQVFESIEDINSYLLNSRQAQTLFAQQGDTPGRALFLFFDEQIEALCQALKLDVILPPNRLVREIDSKIVTTEIGNQAGVRSVPNVLTRVKSYADLQAIAVEAGLGSRWVVQTAYGDSGKTTFFIASEADYQNVATKIEAEDTVKVMRWINCQGTAIEACATRWGTFVGPLLTELIGIESLTPYAGGWCGNELYSDAFAIDIRRQVQQKSQAIGDALYQRGYHGYFELDYLIDRESGEVYLGELNARITGISAMTNLSDFSAESIPLFLFHLLEYDPAVALELDVDAFNQTMLAAGAAGTASQMILKYTDAPLKIITAAPASGVYALKADGQLELKRTSVNRRDALASNEAYVLRIMAAGEYAYKGGDLAILFLNQVIADTQGKGAGQGQGQLNPDGERWVAALKRSFQMRQLNQEERSLVEQFRNPANVKGGREA